MASDTGLALFEHARHAGLPVRQVQTKSGLQLLRVQARVERALCRCGEGGGGHRGHIVRASFQGHTQGLSLLQHKAGVAVPAGFAAGHQVA